MKTIILKNNTASDLKIDSMGLLIEVNQQASLNWEEVLEATDDSELMNDIQNSRIIVNDGTSDLTPSAAEEYLSIQQDLSGYYTKPETDSLLSSKSDVSHLHGGVYYTEAEVDAKIAGIEGYGIVGAVDDIDDLPSSYSGNVGDIYIVRMSVGQGSGGPAPFTVDTNTGLYLPMEESWQDDLGHSGSMNSSMDPVSSPLTPPFGTKYCDFDGNNDFLYFNSSGDFGEGPHLTVGGWIYTKRYGCQGIIGRWDDNGDGWKLDIYGGKLRASLDTLSMSPIQFMDPNTITQNQWIHVAMVYDGNYCILYRNATEVNRVSASGSTIDSDDMELRVGRWMGDDDDERYFYGGMKDMFVQNSAMTQEQLQNLVEGDFQSFADEGFYQWDGSQWIFLARNTGEAGGSGSSYHNSLLGLNSDDYQHLTQSEKDYALNHTHDDRYYTETEIDNALSVKSDSSHNHDTRYYTQSEINSKLNLTYSDISNNDSSTNITGAELETLTNGGNADGLHTHDGGSGSGSGGLDEAYDNHSQWSQGVGRQINVDTGSVTLNASGGFAPLKLTPISYKPTQWLSGGELCIYDNELFLYDATRSKWLSVSGHYIGGGVNSSNVKDCYLKGYNGASFSSNVGWAAHWDGTVVSFSITSDDTGCYNSVQIRKNGSEMYSLWYGHEKEQHVTNVNVDFSAGDILNFYMDGSSNSADRPQVWAIIKRRIS